MAEYGNAGQNRGSTFGRSLMNYIGNRLPYSEPLGVIDKIQRINPKYKDFYGSGTRRDELLSQQAVSTNSTKSDHPMASVAIDKNYHSFMYANVDYDKQKRLRDYRVMAQFAEVGDALDEICDECINKDDKGDVVKMKFRHNYDPVIKKELEEEFGRFIAHYQLEQRGWEYFRQVLVDGEVFFEHIIHEKYTDAGILGVINIPSELVDPIYDNVQNLLIKGFLLRKPSEDNNKKDGNSGKNFYQSTDKQIEMIPFDKNQITYLHSGSWNENKNIRLPFIEQGRRAYRQLSLIEDAIVVYRLVRAPERLIFNVDVGNMPPPKAEAYLKKLMNNYWSRKTYDSSQGKSVQAFNPQSMLDNFWFAKRAGSTGTEVISLPGGQNLGELSDLLYFKQKLYRALKVPSGRLDPQSTNDIQGSSILREELKFAKFVIKLQMGFASGLKDAFVTHLKLKDLWEDYELKELHFDITFNPPTNFHELRNQQIMDLKFANYGTMVSNPLVSDTYAKKNYLGLNDQEIKDNREMLRKDAALEWELAQITAMGPNWREQYQQAEDAAENAAAPPPPGGAPMPPPGGAAGPALPPEFGAPPAAPGGEIPPPGGQAAPAAVPPAGQTGLPA